MVSIYQCSSLSQFPNQMTHEKKRMTKMSQSSCAGSHRTQAALTCPGSPWVCHLPLEGGRCTLHLPGPVPRGHNFPWDLTTPHQVNSPLEGSTKRPRLTAPIWQLSPPNHSEHRQCPSTPSQEKNQIRGRETPDTAQVTALCLSQGPFASFFMS